ncbi:hypothetical protein O181_021652 [Austropuccinia psidii MF-1]|uniref:Uncharacterized protein n=1 Tax=Austropuccinia psidii MF-1 TaxID=1389203 RepID=A0A9Q3CFX8_9BASI|nr:hypothetical protein [Austropuccinia psidii MF-1]
MANWSCHHFYGKLVHIGVVWPLGHTTSTGHFWLKPYPASFCLLANFSPHQPPSQLLCFGPGGPFGLPGASGPSSHHQRPWSHPFHYRALGLKGLFGHLGSLPPLRPTVRETLRPLLAQIPQSHQSKNGQKDPRTQTGQEPQSCHLPNANLWKPPEATSSIPEIHPLHSGERLSFTNALCTNDSGMVHIWYNIPLCTSFSQKSNGDVFRTKICH